MPLDDDAAVVVVVVVFPQCNARAAVAANGRRQKSPARRVNSEMAKSAAFISSRAAADFPSSSKAALDPGASSLFFVFL